MMSRVEEKSLAPEVSIVDVQHGFYWHDDGRVTALYEVTALHEPGLTDQDFDRLADSTDRAWNGLPEQTSFQFFTFVDHRSGVRKLEERFPPILGGGPVYQALEEFRRGRMAEFKRIEEGQHGASLVQDRQHFVAATFTPSFVNMSPLQRIVDLGRRWLFRAEGSAAQPEQAFQKALQEARTFCRTAEVGLLQMGLGFRRAKDAELLGLLHRMLSPTTSDSVKLTEIAERCRRQPLDVPQSILEDVPFAAPNSPVWGLQEDDIVFREKYVRMGDWYVAVISTKQLADQTSPGMLVPLLRLGLRRYYLCYRVEIPRQKEALAELAWTAVLAAGLRLKNLLAKNDRADAKADEIGRQADEAMAESVKGLARVLGLGLNVVLYERTPEALDGAVEEVLGRMAEAYGLRGIRERYMAREAFLSTLPGAPQLVERRRTAQTAEASNLMPTFDFRWESGKVPFTTPNNSVVCIDPYAEGNKNANVMVIGESGAGKSCTVGVFLSGYELAVAAKGGKRPYTFILDNGGSFARYAELMGGRYVPFSFADPPGVDVFRFDPEHDDIREHISRLQWLALDFLHIKQEDEERFELIKSVLEEALRRVYDGKHTPSWGGLREAVKIVGGRFAEDLATGLYPYAEGKFAPLFEPNKEREMRPDIHVMCYDFEGLGKHPDLAMVGLRLTTFDVLRWSSRASRLRHHCFLVTDESYKFMTGQGSFAKSGGVFLEECFRQGRKNGLSVITLSQGLMEYADNKHGKAVIDNCFTKLIGPAGAESFELIKDRFQLNHRQIEQLSGLKRVDGQYTEFLALQGKTTFVIRVPWDAFTRWVFTTAKEDRNRIAEFSERHPDMPLLEQIRRLSELA